MANDFDITSILAFQPPGYVCPACRGLYLIPKTIREPEHAETCPVCKVRYNMPTWIDDPPHIYKMLGFGGYRLGESNMLAHARTLANTLQSSKPSIIRTTPWPTMRLLLEILARAKLFVHFTSWGISHLLIGALKATSMRVPVYGLVSNVEDYTKAELLDYPSEAPNFKVQVIKSAQGIYEAPHQKLVVVDGLIAFKGSTNLTNAGMRRADRLLDVTEVETNVGKVLDLNNRYFSPVWKKLTAPGDDYEMDWAPF
jgi:hypothetical protein